MYSGSAFFPHENKKNKHKAINIVFSDTIPWIAELLIHKFVIAFEVAGVLLLAAVLGAFVVLRRDREEREMN